MSDADANTFEAPTATAVLEHIVRSIVDDADAVNDDVEVDVDFVDD
ncbi:MAG: hypothetical protein ACKOQ7_01870 [Actinomycetota bacterium]